MKTHSLKINREYFKEVVKGTKKFELRKDDRGYMVGDTLILNEFLKVKKLFTGQGVVVRVTSILRVSKFIETDVNWVIMSIERLR